MNATLESPTATPPSPFTREQPSSQEIDDEIIAYEQLQKAADAAEKDRADAEARLIALVKAYGTVPEEAQQSRRLQGVHSVATVTMGITRTLHEPSIVTLNNYLSEIGKLWVFERIFATSMKFMLIDGARDVLNGIDLPKRTREKILQLFGMCIDVKDKKPSLTVKAVKPQKVARKPRAGKQAA